MGVVMESQIVKKTQGARDDANKRLDQLIYEQQMTNYLLGQVLAVLRGEQTAPEPSVERSGF